MRLRSKESRLDGGRSYGALEFNGLGVRNMVGLEFDGTGIEGGKKGFGEGKFTHGVNNRMRLVKREIIRP